jgi:transposase
MGRVATRRRRPSTSAVVVLVGWLVVSGVAIAPEDADRLSSSLGSGGEEAWPANFLRERNTADLGRMCPRELRRLPGLGQVRALAYARARWQNDPALGPLALEAVPGIGPETARRVAAELERPP